MQSQAKILTYPNPILRKISEPITEFNQETIELASTLISLMEFHHGLGLSAPQVGVLKRMVAINSASILELLGQSGNDNKPLILCNPFITETGKEKVTYTEGCLSFPGLHEPVSSYESITVEYMDHNGIPQESQFNDILATVIQHEIDHLDGKLFIDRMSKKKRNQIQVFAMKKRND